MLLPQQDEPWLALYLATYLKDLGTTLLVLRLLKLGTNPFDGSVVWVNDALEVHLRGSARARVFGCVRACVRACARAACVLVWGP